MVSLDRLFYFYRNIYLTESLFISIGYICIGFELTGLRLMFCLCFMIWLGFINVLYRILYESEIFLFVIEINLLNNI